MRVRLLVTMLLLVAPAGLPAQNAALRTLEREDQAVRAGDTTIKRSDRDRERQVLEILARGGMRTPEDEFNAALVLQHTPFDFCGGRMVSMSPDNYLLAHYLALRSFAGGDADARILVAQTIDRYLWMTAGYQKYGTNRAFNQQSGREELVPIDRTVTDSERAVFGVPPLAALLRRWPEQVRSDSAVAPRAPTHHDSSTGDLPHERQTTPY